MSFFPFTSGLRVLYGLRGLAMQTKVTRLIYHRCMKAEEVARFFNLYVFESTRDAQGELIEIRKTIDEPEYDMFRDMLEDVRVERVQLKVDAGRGMASALERGSTATTVGETLLYRKANLMQPYPKGDPNKKHHFYTERKLNEYKALTGSKEGFEHHPVLCVGDVVLFQLDWTKPVMVSRVAAGPHQEMVSTEPTDKPFKVPAFHFWVMADDPEVPLAEASDSRSLGPIPFEKVKGRVMYFRRGLEHGAVTNSEDVQVLDELLLEHEGEVEEFVSHIQDGESSDKQE